MKLTYYGHGCIGVRIEGVDLLFDPYISENPLAKHIEISTVPADYILISHGHYDHIADAVPIAKRTGATVIANYEITQWLAKQGLQRLHSMNAGGVAKFSFGRLRLVQAAHSSSMPDGTYGGTAVSFVIESPEGNFFFSGDTGLTAEMDIVGRFIPLKFAVLCIGGTYTMDVDTAVHAATLLHTDLVVGIHYDTIPPLAIDKQQAIQKFDSVLKQLILLEPGESIDL